MSDPATFWEEHLGALAEHEWGLFTAIERRAQILAGLSASVVGGMTLLRFHHEYGAAWSSLSWLASLEATVGMALAVVATLVFAFTLTPLEGRNLPEGSVASRLKTGLDGLGRRPRLLTAGSLSEEVRAACRKDEVASHEAHASEGARAMLAAWLQRRVGADLGWWLGDGDERVSQARFRLGMHYWATRQAVQEKGKLLAFGMNVALVGTGVLTLAALTAWATWLGVVALLVPIGLAVRRLL